MTNNMGKHVVAAKRKSHTLPPLDGGAQVEANGNRMFLVLRSLRKYTGFINYDG